MPVIESIQAAVGVFFEEVKIGEVVLDAIAVQVAKEPQRRLLVNKEKAAKIGVEFLDPGSRRNKIIVVAQIVQLHLDKSFLKTEVIVEAIRALAHIRAHDAQFANIEIVQAEFGRDANPPIRGLERSVAMKQIERKSQRLIDKRLFAFAEEIRAARARAAHVARRRDAAAIKKSFGRSRDIEKNLLSQHFRPDRLVAFEAIAVERIVPARLGVDVLAALRIAAIVGLAERPAIRHRVEHVSGRRKVFSSQFHDVIGIRIKPMAKLAVAAGAWRSFRCRRGAKFWKTWQARPKFGAGRSRERNFQC